jgi:hypothetical protein
MKDYKFILGDLVLMRNTTIKKALNRKMRACYLSPLIVISHNKGGTYILSKLNGMLLHRPVAAFHIILYFTRKQLLNVSMSHLCELENMTEEDPEGLLDNDDNFDAAEDDA